MSPYQFSSHEEILRRYRRALSALREWGILVPPGCRLTAYEERLAGRATRLVPYVPEHEIIEAMFDFREVDEIIDIVESFPKGPGATARERLSKIPAGSEHPDDEIESQARDAQFELYLRAVLRKGGLRVALGQPDLQVRLGGEWVPVEAKRPKSEARVDDRLRKGISQLETQVHGGFVAMSLDLVLRPSNQHMVGVSRQALEIGLQQIMFDFIGANLAKIARRVAGRPVHGLCFAARIPGCLHDLSEMWLISHYHTEVLSGTEKAAKALEHIHHALTEAS